MIKANKFAMRSSIIRQNYIEYLEKTSYVQVRSDSAIVYDPSCMDYLAVDKCKRGSYIYYWSLIRFIKPQYLYAIRRLVPDGSIINVVPKGYFYSGDFFNRHQQDLVHSVINGDFYKKLKSVRKSKVPTPDDLPSSQTAITTFFETNK